MRAKIKVEVDRLTKTAIFTATAKDGARTVTSRGSTRGEALEWLKATILKHRALDWLEANYPQEEELEL